MTNTLVNQFKYHLLVYLLVAVSSPFGPLLPPVGAALLEGLFRGLTVGFIIGLFILIGERE